MTEEQLRQIEERANKATEAPWIAHPRSIHNSDDGEERSGLGFDIDGPPEPQLRGQFSRGKDAVFIAHARTDIPALIAEVRRLREALEGIEKMPCLAELLGEPGGYPECGCARCQARVALEGEKHDN